MSNKSGIGTSALGIQYEVYNIVYGPPSLRLCSGQALIGSIKRIVP
jgi:hypothetical protein